jgi:uncharacterized membrane protein
MSLVSQTPARRRPGSAARLAAGLGGVAAVLAAGLGGLWRPLLETARAGRLHAPDLALFAALSPAIKVHLVAALAALALGGLLMALRKGRRFHRIAGWAWVSLVAATAGSSLFITSLRPGHWSLLHLLTAWVLLVLPLAVMWARRRDVARHRRAMMGLFYGGFAINALVAFLPGRAMWMMVFG